MSWPLIDRVNEAGEGGCLHDKLSNLVLVPMNCVLLPFGICKDCGQNVLITRIYGPKGGEKDDNVDPSCSGEYERLRPPERYQDNAE